MAEPVRVNLAGPTRVDLAGPLAGRYVLVDVEKLTFGTIEDISSGQAAGLLDGLSSIIVGGNLEKGNDRAGLRALTLPQGKALIEGVSEIVSVPKSG